MALRGSPPGSGVPGRGAAEGHDPNAAQGHHPEFRELECGEGRHPHVGLGAGRPGEGGDANRRGDVRVALPPPSSVVKEALTMGDTGRSGPAVAPAIAGFAWMNARAGRLSVQRPAAKAPSGKCRLAGVPVLVPVAEGQQRDRGPCVEDEGSVDRSRRTGRQTRPRCRLLAPGRRASEGPLGSVSQSRVRGAQRSARRCMAHRQGVDGGRPTRVVGFRARLRVLSRISMPPVDSNETTRRGSAPLPGRQQSGF